jgi:hypothetical protein
MLGRAGPWFCAIVCAALVLVRTRPLHAAPAARTFSLDYVAPEGCPARSTFVASILVRAPGSREATEDAELAFEVRIAPAGALTSGVFTVRFVHGEHFEREVPPAHCADVTTSMAIMAGLLLSGALLPEPPPAPAQDTAPPLAPEPVVVPAPAPIAPAPPASASVEPPRAPSSRTEATTLGRFRPAAFTHAVLDLGGLPLPAFGFDAGLDAALERRSLLAPSLRAGFSYRGAQASLPPVGDGSFALPVLMLRACPLRVAVTAPLFVHACALADFGRLSVSGRNTTHPTERHMPWQAFGGAARFEVRLGSVVSIEAETSLYGLVRHDAFVLEPGGVELHDVPAVSGEVTVGVSAGLP